MRIILKTTLILCLPLLVSSQDMCPGAYDLGTFFCGDSASESGDAGTTPDPEATACMIGLMGTWYTFTTDESLLEFTISGTDYELFEGSCGGLNFVDGCGNGIVIAADHTTDYYVLVNGDFTIDTPNAPSNDNCSNAIDATGGITGEDNSCSSTDDGICGSDGNASVWYSYDVGQDLESFEIDIIAGGITDPVLAVYDACGSQLVEECSSELTMTCLIAGTYIIQVASDYTNAGSFDLSFIETASTVSNDNCDSAEDITPSASCSEETVSGDSTGACPESTDYGSGCDINVHPTVWFSFETGNNTSTVDLINLSSNLELVVMESNCGGAVFPCVTSDINLPVNTNTDYYIAATLVSGGGSFEFDIQLNEAPENDLCVDATSIESSGFTTCCGAIEGIDQCGGSETGVWLVYDGLDGEGTLYTFTNIDMSGSVGIEIYEGDCGGLLLLNEPYCGGAGTYTFETPNCDATTHYIHITSSNSGCGSFELTADPVVGCATAEDCGDGPTLAPTTGSGEVCAPSCNQFACDSGCGTGGVWFVVETDELATEMSVVVNDLGNSNVDPVVTILQSDCSGGALVICEDVASGDIIETAVSGNQIYYIEVSTGSGGDPGDFELCVSTDESLVECSDGSIDVTRPEYPDADPEGPYCPGEIVNFCYDVTFTVDPIGQGNNCQWIQGIIPTVGGGWDLEALPLDVQGPGGSWFWLDEEEVEYQAPSSILGIINTPHGLGLEYGPGTLTDGDALPGGWWSVTDGGGGCANNGNPNTMWGLPAGCGSTQDVSFCFDLQVGLLEDASECTDPDFTDLKVHIFTMADGQTGCWSNNSCSGDTPVTFNAEIDCTSLVFIDAEDTEICHDDVLNLPVMTEDGSSVDIIVEVIEEGNTSGASDWEFPNGSGIIADQITNEGEDVEIVIYEAYASDPNSTCEGPRKQIEVVVYPEIIIEGEDPYYICYLLPVEVEPTVTGGDGGPYTYLWETGETTSSIVLPDNPDQFPGEYEIQLTVTDNFGCVKTENITYEIVEPVYPEIINPYIGVCKDGTEDLPELFIEFESAGTGPYEYLWTSSPGGLRYENGDNDENLIINEEESSARTYTITGTVIDDYGCEYSAETTLIVDNGPDMILEIDECFGTEFLLSGYERDGLLVNFSLYFDQEGDWIFDGTSILNAELLVMQFGDQLSYLASDYGTYILLGMSQNGCFEYEELDLPPVPQPEFQVLPNDTICAGTTITVSVLNANEYVDFNWSVNANGSSFTDTPLDTITYYLEAETSDDCEVTDSVMVIVNNIPPVNVTGSRSICPGAQTILTAQGNPAFSYLWNGPNGEMITSQTATISAIGTWDITVVSTAGCMNTGQVEILENQQLDPQIDGANLCTGSSVILDGGPGFDTYEWLDALGTVISNQQTLSVDQGGDYILNVELGSGQAACSGSDTFTVLQFDPIENALISDSTEVCNIDNGSLVTVIDLTAFENNINGSWLNNNNVPVVNPMAVDFTGRNPGVYRYRFVTQAAMPPCQDESFNFFITVLDCACPDIGIARAPDFCAETDTFDLELLKRTSEEGTWSVTPGSLTIEDDNLIISESTIPGIYSLAFTLTASGIPPACQIDSIVNFEVFAPLDAELINDVVVCNLDTGNGPDSLDLDDLYLSGSPGEWSASDASITIDENNLVRFTGLTPRTYRFSYYMEDTLSACEPVNLNVNVRVIDCSCPVLELLDLPDLCTSGGRTVLSDYLNNPDNEAGSWSISGPDNSALIGGSVFSDDRLPGMYTATYRLNNPAGGNCVEDVSASFTIFEEPSAELEDDVFACNGTNLTVYPTVLNLDDFVSGDPGVWAAPLDYNNGILPDPNAVDFEGLDPGSYFFEYTTNSAIDPCVDQSYTLEVIVRNCNCPSVAFIPPTPLCNDGPDVNLNDYLPEDAPSGQWSFVNGSPQIDIENDSLFTLNGLEGFYLFQFTLDTVPQGCPDFGQISIEILSPPQVQHIPEEQVCNQQSVIAGNCIDLTEYLTGVDGSWTFDPTFDGDRSDTTNLCFDSENPGEVLFFIFNTNAGIVSCDERQYVTSITVLDCSCPLYEFLTPPILCSDEGFFDLGSIESGILPDGNWSFESGPQMLDLDASTGILDISNAQSGIYTLRYTASENLPADCDQFADISLEISRDLSLGELVNDGDCIEVGQTVILDNYLLDQDAGGEWRYEASGIAPDQDGQTRFDFSGLDAGTYSFTYGFYNNAACDDKFIELQLNLQSLAEAEVNDPPCPDENSGSILLASLTQGQNLLYSIDGGQSWTTESVFDGLSPGVYNIMIEDENGCLSQISNLNIAAPAAISVDAGDDMEVLSNEGDITITVNSSIDVDDIAFVEWTQDGSTICSGTASECLDLVIDASQIDEFAEFCISISTIDACYIEDCLFIRERIVKDVYIANIFSPQSQSTDDTWFVQSDSEYLEAVTGFSIFDRWGNLVFDQKDEHPPNNPAYGWDGTMDGNYVLQGVYVYLVKVRFTDGEERILTGDLTLLRN